MTQNEITTEVLSFDTADPDLKNPLSTDEKTPCSSQLPKLTSLYTKKNTRFDKMVRDHTKRVR